MNVLKYPRTKSCISGMSERMNIADLIIYVYDVLFIVICVAAICKCEVAYTLEKESKKLYKYLQIVFILYCVEGVFKTGFGIATGTLSAGNTTAEIYILYCIPSIIILSIENVFYGMCLYRYREEKVQYYHIIPVVLFMIYEIISVFQEPTMFWLLTGKNANVICIMVVFCMAGLPINKKQSDDKLKSQSKFYKALMVYFVGAVLENIVFCLNREEWNRVFPTYEDRMHIADDIFCVVLVIATIRLANKEIEHFNRLEVERIVKQRILEYEVEHKKEEDKSKDDTVKAFCKQYGLTNREIEILFFILEGKGNQDIANELYITVGTVKAHVHSIFQKLEVSRRSQIIKKYIEYDERSS